MSIAETQRSLVKDQLLYEHLKQGEYPSLYVIHSLVDKAFEENMAGLPRFTMHPIEKGKVSNKNEYNDMMQKILMDLTVAFEEVKRINNKMMSLTQYYESSRIKTNKLIENAALKANALSLKADRTVFSDVFGDEFCDFLNINFIEDAKRNIPKTTAFVDLLHNSVEMQRQKKSTYQHNLRDAKISFQAVSGQTIHEMYDVRNLLTDTLDDAWHTVVVSKEQTNIVGELLLELPEVITATNVAIDLQMGKPIYTTLLVSLDGLEYTRLETRKIISEYQWTMEARDIKFIKFEMEKKEEDRVTGSEFEYIFGGKNIQVLEELYEDRSQFVSKAFELISHEAVEAVTLQVEHSIPPDTNIQYYVGLDYKDNVIEWQEIKKDGTIRTNMVQSMQMEITPSTPNYGELIMTRYGMDFYRICQLAQKPLKGSIQLLMGRNMWLKETIKAPFIYEPTEDESDDIVYPTGVHDWTRTVTPKKGYVHIQNGFDYLKANHFHRYTCYIQSAQRATHRATFQGTSDTSLAVSLNNMQVKGINNQYELNLQEGWNKIELYVYAREINQEIILDFYLPEMNYQIFANSEPVKEVSMYDMLNNTSTRDHHKVAVDENNNLIVSYNPRSHRIIERYQVSDLTAAIDGLEYALRYKYSLGNQNHHAIRLMAILSKNKERVKTTPRIQGYKLIVE